MVPQCACTEYLLKLMVCEYSQNIVNIVRESNTLYDSANYKLNTIKQVYKLWK